MEDNNKIAKVNEAVLPMWKLKQTRNQDTIVRAIGRLVTKAFLDTGKEATVKESGYIALRIWQEIEGARADRGQYYRSLSGDDLAECFNNGALGRYGENYGLSVATFIQWIDRYHDEWTEKKRREYALAQDKKRIEESRQIEQHPTMTREQAIERSKRVINDQYKLFLSLGDSFKVDEPKSIGNVLAFQDWGGVLRRTIESEKGIKIKDIKTYFLECRKNGMEKIF